jgi:hypothetical protein
LVPECEGGELVPDGGVHHREVRRLVFKLKVVLAQDFRAEEAGQVLPVHNVLGRDVVKRFGSDMRNMYKYDFKSVYANVSSQVTTTNLRQRQSSAHSIFLSPSLPKTSCPTKETATRTDVAFYFM